jgi:hypothetical protein
MIARFSTKRIFNSVYSLNDYSGRFVSLGNQFTNTIFIVARLDQPLHQRFFDFLACNISASSTETNSALPAPVLVRISLHF